MLRGLALCVAKSFFGCFGFEISELERGDAWLGVFAEGFGGWPVCSSLIRNSLNWFQVRNCDFDVPEVLVIGTE